MTYTDATATPNPTPQNSSPAPERKKGLSTPALVLLIVGGLVVALGLLIGLAVWAVLAATSGPVKAANAFFATTAASGPSVSYGMASPSFRSVVSEAQWAAYAQRYGLSAYTGASWSSRNLTNNVAVLQGSLKVGGGALPATVQLSNGGSGWQVLHLNLADSGLSQGAGGEAAQAAPSISSIDDAAAQPSSAYNGDSLSAATSAPSPATTGAGKVVPGAMLSGLCRQVLVQQANAAFDSIECPDPLPARPGATTACMVRKGGQSALMTVRLETFDATTGHFTADCKVADHPLS